MPTSLHGRERWIFWAILAAAAAIRAWVALKTGPVHADEVFQYLEQAHRHSFGSGVVPWEYRYGMRSWLPPLVLSVPMRIGEWIAPGTGLYIALPQLCVAALSLLVVTAAFRLGDRLSRFHAFVAMAVAATWYDIAYFGGHVLTEPAAVSLILPAAALLIDEQASRRRLALAGFLLGLAVLLRFHYAPAAAVLVALCCGTRWRTRWAPVVAGGLAAIAVGAAVDIAMGEAPFGWVAVNFTQNIVVNRSARYGVLPPWGYLDSLFFVWGIGLVGLLLLLVPVLKPYRALIAAAVVNLAVHSAIGHKEYRFIFLTVAIIVIVAAIGSAELVRRLKGRVPERRARIAALAIVPLWIGASAALAAQGKLRSEWSAAVAGAQASALLRVQPDLCGVGLVGVGTLDAGGYTHLHRPVPVYLVDPPYHIGPQRPLAELASAFDAALVPEHRVRTLPPSYRPLGCSEGRHGVDPHRRWTKVRICAFVREGGCDPSIARYHEVNAVARRHDW
jgi:hypothetical protein